MHSVLMISSQKVSPTADDATNVFPGGIFREAGEYISGNPTRGSSAAQGSLTREFGSSH